MTTNRSVPGPALEEEIANEISGLFKAINLDQPSFDNAGRSFNEPEMEEPHRAWVAPAHRVLIEILSIIFVDATLIDWRAPFVLGRVCRHWRHTVLQTPKAWSMIKLNLIKPGLHISTIIARSEPFPIDLIIADSSDPHALALIPELQGRIKSMMVEFKSFYVPQHSFPQLTDLVLLVPHSISHEHPKAILDRNIFPNLQSLTCGAVLDAISGEIPPNIALPPIKRLALMTRKLDTTIKLLQRLSNQLVVLHIEIYGPIERHAFSEPLHVIFPQLNTLTIIPPSSFVYGPSFEWPFVARTPILESYVEKSLQFCNIHKDTWNVTRLAFSGGTNLRLFPKLRDVIGNSVTMTTLMDYLEMNPKALPDLKRVTFHRAKLFEDRLDRFNLKYGRNIVTNIVEMPISFLSPFSSWDINDV